MNTDIELSNRWREQPIGAETGPQVVGSMGGNFTVEDQQLATYLLRQVDKTIDIAIPDGIDDETLGKQLKSSMRVYSRIDGVRRLLQPIIGRMMLLMESRPALLGSFGVTSLKDFCEMVCPSQFGIARSEAYFIRKIVALFPDISPQQYCDAKPVNLKLIGKALNWESSPKAHEYMLAAQGKTCKEMLKFLADDGVDVNAIQTCKITTTVTLETRLRFEAFLEHPLVQAYCETSSPEQVIIRMLDECESQWIPVMEIKNRMENHE